MAGSVEGVLLLSLECTQVAPGVWPTSFVSLGLLKYSIQIREKRLLSVPELEKQKTGAVFRSLMHTTRLWRAGESPVSPCLQSPPPSGLKGEAEKPEK